MLREEFLRAGKAPLMRGDYGSLAADNLDENAEQKKAEAAKNRIYHFTDKVMYPVYDICDKVIDAKKKLDEAIAYYKKPFGLFGATRLSSDASCLEAIQVATENLIKALGEFRKQRPQAELIAELKPQYAVEQKFVADLKFNQETRFNYALSETPEKFKTMLANALLQRMDLVLAGEGDAKAALDAIDLFHLNIYFLTYSKKIEIENPPQAQFLRGLQAVLSEAIAESFPKPVVAPDAKK